MFYIQFLLYAAIYLHSSQVLLRQRSQTGSIFFAWWLKVHVSIHKIRENDWKVFLSSYNITLSIFTRGKNGAIVSPAVWRHNQRYRGKQFFPDLLCFRIPAFHICPRKSYAKVSVAVLSHNQRYSGRQFFPDLLCFRNRASFHICSRKKIMPKCQSQY